MLQKLLKGRTLALVAVVVALFANMAQAASQQYSYEGTIVEVKDRNVTIVNNDEKSVVHAVVPANVHLSPAFTPGDKVVVKLTKTDIGRWNVVKMKKTN